MCLKENKYRVCRQSRLEQIERAPLGLVVSNARCCELSTNDTRGKSGFRLIQRLFRGETKPSKHRFSL